MAFKKKEKRGLPAVSTAALPDIVFMLLFFFMVAASIKNNNYDKYIKIDRVRGDQFEKMERKELASYIYVGVPAKQKSGQLMVINDKIVPDDNMANGIYNFVTKEKDVLKNINPDLVDSLEMQLIFDKTTNMFYVSRIKKSLSEANQLNVRYVGNPMFQNQEIDINFK